MITFVKIIILLVSIVSMCFFLYEIIIAVTEKESKNSVEDGIRLKFKDFLKFYYLNPFRWELEDYTPYYHSTDKYIVFSLIDTFRYKRFKESIEKQKRKKREEKMTIDFLKSIQQSINFEYDQITKNTKNIIKR